MALHASHHTNAPNHVHMQKHAGAHWAAAAAARLNPALNPLPEGGGDLNPLPDEFEGEKEEEPAAAAPSKFEGEKEEEPAAVSPSKFKAAAAAVEI